MALVAASANELRASRLRSELRCRKCPWPCKPCYCSSDTLLITLPLALAGAIAFVLVNRHRAKRGKRALPGWAEWVCIIGILVSVHVIA